MVPSMQEFIFDDNFYWEDDFPLYQQADVLTASQANISKLNYTLLFIIEFFEKKWGRT